MVYLACDLVTAGVDGPATLEMAGQSLRIERPEAEPLFRAMLAELGLPVVPHDPKVLLHLVHEADFDTLLTIVSIPEIAAAWLSDRESDGRNPDSEHPDEWASWLWSSTEWYSDQDRLRSAIVELIAQADSELELARIAAGPLENFVCDEESTLRWIEEQASISPKLRSALTHAWLWQQLSPESFVRVERAAGSPLAKSNPTSDRVAEG